MTGTTGQLDCVVVLGARTRVVWKIPRSKRFIILQEPVRNAHRNRDRDTIFEEGIMSSA